MIARNIFALLAFHLAGLNVYAQLIETVNTIVLSQKPAKSYIVNNEGRIVPGSDGVIIYASLSFFMRANSNYYSSPSPLQNFVRTQVFRPASGSGIPGLPVFPKSTIFEYFDGLGTLRQTIRKGYSPSSNDNIEFNVPDEFGRLSKAFLPYAKKGGGAYRDSLLEEQARFYNGTFAVAADKEPFGLNEYDRSPRNNITKSFSVGWRWHTALPSSNSMRINTAGEVKRIGINGSGFPAYAIGQFYAKGTLAVTELKDESGQVTRTYRNFNNELILERVGKGSTWRDTYYLYDKAGRVKFIVPPDASVRIDRYSGTLNMQPFADTWCFQYRYDVHGRMTEKKIPGADWIYMVYDRWDRLVLTQDGNQRLQNQWLYTKYDVHNRPVMTGIMMASRAAAEADILKNPNRHEEREMNSIGYSNKTYPTHYEETLLTINYYDCYNFLKYPSWDKDKLNFLPRPVPGIVDTAKLFFQVSAAASLPVVRGYQTGSKVKVLNQSVARWLNEVTYYDREYQPVQVISENVPGGIDVHSKRIDKLSGVTYQSQRLHYSPLDTITINEDYVYDDEDRLLRIYHQINNQPRILMVSNSYNELGQLIEKNIHSTDEKTFLQSVDFRYNIQGWLTHINNSSLTDDQMINNDVDDFFGMEIIYNDSVYLNDGKFKPLRHFDGNIAAVKWKTRTNEPGSSSPEKIYGFNYDDLKRFKAAYYATNNSGLWKGNAGLYNENVSGYDANGNVGGLSGTGLTRNGVANGAMALIDNLSYRYAGNQLQNVADISLHNSGFKDKPGTDASLNEYNYDKNGNLTDDMNKSITSIVYNHLNRPRQLDFTRVSPVRTDRLTYTYDALGNKLMREVSVGSAPVWKSLYADGIQYDNDIVSFLMTPEGRAVFNGREFSYEYFLRDHQKNIRVVCGVSKETSSYLATMETPLESREKDTYGFLNIAATRSSGNNFTASSDLVLFPDKSARCNGFGSSTVKAAPIGPAKTFTVGSQDEIYCEVYARFNNVKTVGTVILPTLLSSFVTSTFNISSIETPLLYKNMVAKVPYLMADTSYADIVPKAYLVLMYFDKGDNYVSSSAKAISEAAFMSFEKLSVSFKAPGEGKVFIYVANESNVSSSVDVYFDDLYIIHERNQLKPQIFQACDYYPFGLTFNEFQKDRLKVVRKNGKLEFEPMVRNRYLFQGQELQKDLNLGWYEFRYRMHDPAIARFSSVDPLAEKYTYYSPYSFSGNQLTNAVELEGLESQVLFETMKMFSPVAFKFDFSFTSHDSRIGYNISLGLPKSLPFSFRYEFGGANVYEDIVTGGASTEQRTSFETSHLFGAVSFKTTAYQSGETSQMTGQVTLGLPALNIQYENDWHPDNSILRWADPFSTHPRTQTDKYRTAALSLNAGAGSFGFKFATGDPGPFGHTAKDFSLGGKDGTYVPHEYNGVPYDPNKYRLGLAYFRLGSYQLGLDSESIRHQVQNLWTHDNLVPPSPWFQVMPEYSNQLYFGFSNGSTTQW